MSENKVKKTTCICCNKKKECIEIKSKKYKNYSMCMKCLTTNFHIIEGDSNNIEEVRELVFGK